MKTIRVKRENFDIDGICNKIEEAISNGTIGCEGTVHPAIIDCINNETLYSTSTYDEMDYETVKEEFYKSKVGLALTFVMMGSEDDTIACVNNKEYIINQDDENNDLDLGSFSVDYESANVLYLDCHEDYIYISTAYYGGGGCMTPPRVLIEENWGAFDNVVIEFIKPFIKGEQCEIKALPEFDSIAFYTNRMYIFDDNKLILIDDEEHYFTECERGFDIENIISYFKRSDRQFIPKDFEKRGMKLDLLEMFALRPTYSKIDSIIEKLEEEPSIIKTELIKVSMCKTKESRVDLLEEVKNHHNPLKDYLDKGYIKKSIKEIKEELNIN